MSTQVIDLCQQDLCMAPAVSTVTITNGDQSVDVKVCGKHEQELQDKVRAANEEPGAQLGLTVVPLPARAGA
jgi:hypothetical protein